jgi:hypothetical protein
LANLARILSAENAATKVTPGHGLRANQGKRDEVARLHPRHHRAPPAIIPALCFAEAGTDHKQLNELHAIQERPESTCGATMTNPTSATWPAAVTPGTIFGAESAF